MKNIIHSIGIGVLIAITSMTYGESVFPYSSPTIQNSLCDPSDRYPYVIITCAEMRDAATDVSLQDLAAFRTSHGLNATIVIVEDIYTHYMGRNQVEQIRNFITDAYNTWGTDFVLLGGDVNIIPSQNMFGYAHFPSDYLYQALDGDFDWDGDGKWGEMNEDCEPDGYVDLISDVFVGRASAENPKEMANFVYKTLAHEQEAASAAYKRHALLISEYMFPCQNVIPYMEEQETGSSNWGVTTLGFREAPLMSVSTMYEDYDFDYNFQKLKTAINDDQEPIGIISHFGHSESQGSMDMGMDSIYELENTKGIFVYSQGCHSGNLTDDCIAESLTVSTRNGMYAAIFNTVEGNLRCESTETPTQIMTREFWDVYFSEGISRLGQLHAVSRANCVGVLSDGAIAWLGYVTELFGDPAVVLGAPYDVLDEELPEIDDVSPISETDHTLGCLTMYISATDTVGLMSVTVGGRHARLNADGLWVCTVELNLGWNEFTIAATDHALNRSTQVVRYNRVLSGDLMAPVIERIMPEDGTETDVSVLDILIEAHDDVGVAMVKINGMPATALPGNDWSFHAVLPHRQNQFVVTAIDHDGNITEETVNYLSVEQTPPEIDVVTPASWYITPDRMVEMSIHTHDDTGIEQVLVNGIAAEYVDADSWAFDANLQEEHNLFEITAIDASGNMAQQAVTYICADVDTHYVSPNGSHTPPFTSWATAANTLQDAVDAADDGDTVLVAAGTYASGGMAAPGYSLVNRVALLKSIILLSIDGPANTIIEGQPHASTTPLFGDDAVRCAYLTPGSVIDGFTLRNGYTRDQFGVLKDTCAGGAYLDGGGLLKNCVIEDNNSYEAGGGVFMDGKGQIQQCHILRNMATFQGGNTYMNLGGGIYMTNNGGFVEDSLIADNTARSGGGIYIEETGTIIGCTIAGNTGSSDSGGLYTHGGGIVKNSIIQDNTAYYEHKRNWYSASADLICNNCCLYPSPGPLNNIDVAPGFVNAVAGDYHLLDTSPCIDCGTNGCVRHDEDLDGNMRKAGLLVDIGCFEFVEKLCSITAPEIVQPVVVSPGSVDSLSVSNMQTITVSGSKAADVYVVRADGTRDGIQQDLSGTTWSHDIDLTVETAGKECEFTYACLSSDLQTYSCETTTVSLVNTLTEPVVDITAPATVYAFLVSIDVSCSGLSDDLQWANLTTGDRGRLSASSPCVIPDIRLVQGANEIVVSAVTSVGGIASDSVIITCVDMEYQGATPTHYVATDGSDTPPYNTLEKAARRIQDAIDVAQDGDTVVVYPGTYDEGFGVPAGLSLRSRVCIEKAVTVRSESGAASTIIKGQSPCSSAAVRCAYLTDGASLIGFTLMDGCTLNEGIEGDLNGGGAYINGGSTIGECVVRSSSASASGGGVMCHEGGVVRNSLIEDCSAVEDGGGAYLDQGGSLVNVTIVDNFSKSYGGGLYTDTGGTVANSIIWSNECDRTDSHNNWSAYAGTVPVFDHVCTLPEAAGIAVMSGDPDFFTGQHSKWQLHPDSPCVNAGSSVLCEGAKDLLNQDRVKGFEVDLGAYEMSPPVTRYVSASSGSATPPYTTPETAAQTIQTVVDACDPWDIVLVDDGVYNLGGRAVSGRALVNRVALDKPIRVKSMNGPQFTTIVGQGPLGAGAVRCVYVGEDASLAGFTLQSGHTGIIGEGWKYGVDGGGAFVEKGMLSNCIVRLCSANRNGGGVAIYDCGSIVDSIVDDNNAMTNGGGVYSFNGGQIERCTVMENDVGADGGGVAMYYEGMLRNSLISDNTAGDQGGGVYAGNDVDVCYSTIVGNNAHDAGGAFTVAGASVNSSIIWDNTAPTHPNCNPDPVDNNTYAYSCTTPHPGGVNVIDDSPTFVSASDYHLDELSPCIEAGDVSIEAGIEDHDKETRLLGAATDMGCYEFHVDLGHLDAPDISSPVVVKAPNMGQYNVDDYQDITISGTKQLGSYVARNGSTDGLEQDFMGTNWIDVVEGLQADVSGYVNTLKYTTFTSDMDDETIHAATLNVINYYHPGDVDITTSDGDVNDWVATVNGVNNANVVGMMKWFNHQTGEGGEFEASTDWTINNIRLEPGVNNIEVTGFDAFGGSDTDMVSLTRQTDIESPGDSLTHYVSADGANVAPYTTWENAAHRIQSAVDVAQPGDTVLVTNGIFKQAGRVTPGYKLTNCVMVSKAITVRSINGPAYSTIAGSSRAGTTSGGDDAIRCVYLSNGANLEGFTLTNGYTMMSTALNYWDCSGGGAFIDAGASVSNCIIQKNRSCVVGSGALVYSGGLITHCEILENQPLQSGGLGGGLACIGGEAQYCNIYSNLAAMRGGGVYLTGAGCLRDSYVWMNTTYSGGGGVFCSGGGAVVNTLIRGNWSHYGGGGIRCQSGGVIEQCVIERNTTLSYAGGVYLDQGGVLENCLVVSNGLGLPPGEMPSSAGNGGGVYCYQGGELRNCTIAQNYLYFDGNVTGGGVYCQDGGVLRNCILYHNIGRHNVSVDNYANSGSGMSYEYCCTTPLVTGNGNIAADPIFADMANGDYRLSFGSPCIDMADSVGTPACDLEYLPRPLDGDNNGSAGYDMGCYEYVHPNADTDSDGLLDGDEIGTHNTDPLDSDTDDDGLVDGDEVYFLAQYSFINTALLWHDAKADAESQDGHLVTITSGDEWQEILAQVGTSIQGQNFWIGATDEDVEGVWTWVTGEPFDYTHWLANEPNNYGGLEHYAYVWGAAGVDRWNDGPDAAFPYVLEYYLSTDPCNADTDGDGMSDGWEWQQGQNPLEYTESFDCDGDGLNDLVELQQGTDFNDPDTDDDGMPDGWEVMYGLNPLVDDSALDADMDGLSNLEEYSYLSQYDFVDVSLGWNDAKDDAVVQGGHLVAITSQTEWDTIVQELSADIAGRNFWIGASDQAEEGTWIWVTDEPLGYNRWLPNEPNNYLGIEDFAFVWGAADPALRWNDGPDATLPYVLEWQLSTDPTLADTDCDFMPDGWEVQYGLDPLVDDVQLDADGDGVSNLNEYYQGTNPVNP